MKIKKLIITNVGKLAGEQEISVNKPLILFYGEIRQGKSTILNAVRWACGGKFPDDIISHGQVEASVTIEFEGGSISRSWYKAEGGETKARNISYVLNGKVQQRPAEKIRALLNPFLLDQDFLRNKTELERKQYFTELFAVNTADLDGELLASQQEAQQLRARIAAYGEIDLTPVEPVAVAELDSKLRRMKAGYTAEKAELEAALQKLSEDHQKVVEEVNKFNDRARNHNAGVSQAVMNKKAREKRISDLEKQLSDEKLELSKVSILETIEVKPLPTAPDRKPIQEKITALQPDTSVIEKQIQEAGAVNERSKTYKANLERDKHRRQDSIALAGYEAKHREIKAKKQSMLKGISDKCGIKDLEFDEAGNFVYQRTTAGMISDSQIMTLSSELSALYPDGFGLDLIDRGESLGKSIFDFVERAKREEKTILATIVGEKPANIPSEVGVFVVEDGKLHS